MKRYKGKIQQWDVVNEVFEEDGSPRNSIWLRELGPSYIADAFRWAHAADPKAKLFLNDYNVEGVNAKSTAYYELAKRLRAEGVPVQGFGAQGHLAIQYGFPGQVAENLARFGALGMRTAFTEVDVRMILPVDETKSATQASYYRRLLDACLGARSCTSFTVWGFTDKYSWVPGVFDGRARQRRWTRSTGGRRRTGRCGRGWRRGGERAPSSVSSGPGSEGRSSVEDGPIGDGDVLAVDEFLAGRVARAVRGGVDVGEDGAGAGAWVEDGVDGDAEGSRGPCRPSRCRGWSGTRLR